MDQGGNERTRLRAAPAKNFHRESSGALGPLESALRPSERAASPAEERMWWAWRAGTAGRAHHTSFGLDIRGDVDADVLRKALRLVMARHESLRTRFVATDAGLMVHHASLAELATPFQVVDLRDRIQGPNPGANEDTDGESQLKAVLAEAFSHPFDLEEAPIWRAILIRRGSERSYLHVAIHHAISDAASFGIFFRDLYASYSALLLGSVPELMPAGRSTVPAAPEADQAKALQYWLETLRDAPRPVCLRPDISGADGSRTNTDREGGILVRPLNAAWRGEFERAAAAAAVTTYEAMLACLMAALHRFTGQNNIALGSMTAGRRIPEDEFAIGCFAEPVAWRVAVDPATGVREHVAHVADRVRQGLLHACVPFQRIVERLAPLRDTEASPLFSMLFILQSTFGTMDGRLGDAEATLVFEDELRGASEYEIFIQVTPRDGFDLRATYRRARYSREIIGDLLDAFVLVMAAFASGSSDLVGTVDVLRPPTRAALLFDPNANSQPRAEGETIVDLFERAAKRDPSAIAIHARGHTRNYGEVNQDMRRTAARLLAAGVAAGDRVGVLMDRDVHLPGALLAILRIGAVYVPLDPEHPRAYLSQIIEYTKLAALICDHLNGANAREVTSSAKILLIDEAERSVERDAAAEIALDGLARPSQTSAAYVIFTSGSSGLPKGVLVGHQSLHNLVCWAGETFTPAELRGVLCASSIAFDSSIFELFAPLGNGGGIVLIENLLQLVDRSTRLPVTLLVTGAPSAFLEIVRAGGVPPTTTSVILAGEQVSRALVDDLYAIPSIERVLNVYGPTEATVYATAFEVPRNGSGPPSIGTPIANTRAYVLDECGGVTPFGVMGELGLGGRQLALGYFGRSDLTGERFVSDPHVPGERVYRTGDLAVRTRDGLLWFHGRKDGQIKLRGVRIEVEEIEAQILLHKAVRLVAVKLVAPPEADPVLVAYVVPRDPTSPPDADALRAHLAALLPRLKLPSVYEIRSNLPLNANGKLDRSKLEPPAVRPAHRVRTSTSRTEQAVAEVWHDVLRHGDFTPDDAFFDRGGHSMLLLQLQARLRERFGRAPEIMTFFEASTVRDIAAWYDGRRTGDPYATATDTLPANAPQARRGAGGDDIREVAIVGFSCRLPGANDPNALWTALETRADVVKKVPPQRWSPLSYATAEEPEGGAMQWLAALDDIAGFDPEAFGMTKREADLADPQLRLLLELSAEAIADSGRAKRGGLPRKTGVYVGASFLDYATILARAGIVDGHKSTGNALSMLANRLSREFGLTGPSLCLDTACSSGLVALDMAWRAIVAGDIEAALVGGVALMISPENMADWRAAGMLSPRGRSLSFGAEADGFGVGEGGVVLVLKPLAVAMREGDPIHAVIRGTAVSHDGGESIGVAAPSVSAQASVIRAALNVARLRPDDIDVVETHGTGTPLGDPIEWRALADVFGARAPTLPPCRVTAAKSVFGHLGPGAGLVGVAAMLSALRYGRTAPIRGFGTPNAHLAKTSALAVVDEPQPWQPGSRRRIGGVNSIGFGGVYAHAIIAEAERPIASDTIAADSPFLLVLSAQNARRLVALAQALLPFVESADVTGIRNLCATAARQGDPLQLRCAIMARDAEQLGDRLALLANTDPASDFVALRRRSILVGPAVGGDIGSRISNGDSAAAAALRFVEGETVDWSVLFPLGQFQRVALPTPLRRIRCWALDGATAPAESLATPQHAAPRAASPARAANSSGLLEPIWVPTADAFDSSSSTFAAPRQLVQIGSSNEPILMTGAAAGVADLVDRFTAAGHPAARAESATTPCTRLIVVEPSHPIALVDAVRRFAPRECVLITNTAQAVTGVDRALNPLQAASWGLIEALAREYPEMATRSIDIDCTSQRTCLINEILAEDGRKAVALRSGRRFIPATRALEVEGRGASLIRGGRYLITGGTGGIAERLIGWLANHYDARVFVLARRAPAGPSPADRADGAWFGDITAPGEVSRLVDEVHRTIGGIDGAFHLAGSFVRTRIADVTRDDFDAALTPKLDVALALDEALEHFEPGFLAGFGSWAAYRAPAGYGPYAAANRALAAFMTARRATGKPYTTLVWPGWQSTGMGTAVLDTGDTLEVGTALGCIEPALAAAVAEVLVTVPPSSTRSALPETSRRNAVERPPAAASDWHVLVESRIAEHLGADVARLRGGASFVELGLDSIGARSLARAVGDTAEVNLSPTVFFNYGTLDRLLTRCRELRAANGSNGVAHASVARATVPEPAAISAVSGASDWRLLVESRIAEHLGADAARLRSGASFVELGLDSIGARSLARTVADAAEVNLSPTVFFNYGTLDRLLARCGELRASNGPNGVAHSSVARATGPEPAATATPIDDDVAIIGMACRFPGSEDTNAFWDALVSGRDCIGPVPVERRGADLAAPIFERCTGGFLSHIDGFDGTPFGILPTEARMLEPQQTILLETTLQALEDAGVADGIRGARAGVFVGASANPFPTLDRGPLTAHSLIGRGVALLANRISHAFDLTGPSQAVDTLCSSALVALHQAVRSLRDNECDLAIVAGVRIGLSGRYYEGAIAMQAISPSGRCRPFGEGADGMVPGEGCGVLVLERPAKARAAGRRVRALVAGTAVLHQGRSPGLATPVAAAQAAVIRSALADSRIDASKIDYIEGHGTGTALGDPIEIEGLAKVFSSERRRQLGSVKSNIGHLEPAAGIASLIKVVLALENRRIPPSLHAHPTNRLIDLDSLGFEVPQSCVDWPARSAEARAAGVSAFGIGGTLAHVVLRAEPTTTTGLSVEPTTSALIVPVQAYSTAALARTAVRYAGAFEHAKASPKDLCHSVAVGRLPKPIRAVAVGRNAAELIDRLREIAQSATPRDTVERTANAAPRVAFSFSGQGGYRPGSGADLYRIYPAFRAAYDRCRAGFNALGLSIPRPVEAAGEAASGQIEPLVMQPALMALQIALTALYEDAGVRPLAVTGHSLGEIAAAVAAGALSLDDGITLVAARARQMQAMPAGAMLAIRADPKAVEAVLARLAAAPDIAVLNAPDEVVVSGSPEAIAQAANLAEQAGLGHAPVPVNRAFHSHATEPILAEFHRAIAHLTPSAEANGVSFISAVSGRVESAAALTPTYWSRHIREPVRFTEAAARIVEHADIIVDIGPDGATSRLGPRSTSSRSSARWLGRNGTAESFSLCFTRIIGDLFLAGVPITWSALHPGARRVEVPPYAFDVATGVSARSAPAVETAALPADSAASEDRSSALVGNSAVEQEVHGLVAKALGLPSALIAKDARLMELGADSLILSSLTLRLKERFGAHVPTRRFFTDLGTVATIAAHVADMPRPAARTALPVAEQHDIAPPKRQEIHELKPLPGAFVSAYRERTRGSFQRAVACREVLADRRVSASFTPALKETQYPIVSRRAFGGRFEDIDGNTYVDIAMGFGVQLFGHAHPPIVAALRDALARGLHLGPQAELAADTARRLTALTGTERVAFCNSGTEAVMLAVRLARAATRRDVLVIFDRSYHGFWDGTLLQADGSRAQPLSIGIIPQAGLAVRVLPFGDIDSLQSVLPEAERIAAVLVEPIPSRFPESRPGEFLRALRALCDRIGAALVFDEVLGGFRFHPAGAAGYFGVKPDLAIYGKILGGGVPIGAVAGRATYLDGVDGGFWAYGDTSFPACEQVFFASTFAKNPLSMAAASAVLAELERAGPSLQANLAERTDALVPRLAAAIEATGAPIRATNFTSLFGFDAPPGYAGFFRHLIHRGVYVWEGRTCFLSTAHTDEDLDWLVGAVGDAARAVADPTTATATCRMLPPLKLNQDDVAAAATSNPAQAAAYDEATAAPPEALEEPGSTSTATAMRTVAVMRHHSAPVVLRPVPPGDSPPLHLVHPGGGEVTCYLDLAQALAPIPVLAYEATGIDGGAEPLTSVEDMAECYVKTLITEQPVGPYWLGGWSLGGVIAFDMARRLVQRGHQVNHLFVMDADNPASASDQTPRTEAEKFRLFRRSLGFPVESGTKTSAFDADGALAGCVAEMMARGTSSARASREIALLWSVFRVHVEAMWNYRPRHFCGPMTVIAAAKPERADPLLGWEGLADVVRHAVVPGDHFTMMHGDTAAAIANLLRTALLVREASRSRSGPRADRAVSSHG